MNSATLIGRLARDVDYRESPGGLGVSRFTLAVDKDLSKEKKEEYQRKGLSTADFIGIVAFGKTAELCHKFLAKGRLVAIQGRIQTGSYEKDGEKRYTTDVYASQVQFLEWGEKGSSSKRSLEEMGYVPTDEDIPF